jgi:hypothetical protein
MMVELDPARGMAFRIDASLRSAPSIDPGDVWCHRGPTVPLRLEVRLYRWWLTFGELIANVGYLRRADLTADGQRAS